MFTVENLQYASNETVIIAIDVSGSMYDHVEYVKKMLAGFKLFFTSIGVTQIFLFCIDDRYHDYVYIDVNQLDNYNFQRTGGGGFSIGKLNTTLEKICNDIERNEYLRELRRKPKHMYFITDIYDPLINDITLRNGKVTSIYAE